MNGRKHISLPLLLLGACLVFLVIAPLATVFVKALIINDHLDFSFAAAALSEPQNARMIRNSLLLGLAVVILSSLISIPLAYLFSRTQLGQHKIFDLLFLIPFMTPPYIASMGWILFMQKRGLFSQMVPAFPNGIPLFFTFGGLVLVMSLHIFPFMMVLMKNAMLHIPSSLEEAAAISGAGYGRRLRKIFFPLLTGNYVIGALLVFVKTLSEYGTPYTLGRRIGFDVFTTDIHRYAAVAPIDFGKAAVLASVLVTICMVLWLVQNYITVHHSYNLISGKGSRMRIHRLSSPGKVLAILYIGLILVISIGIPYFSVISTSLIRLRGFGLAAGNFTFHHYVELFTDSETALPAIGNSFLLGLLSATICAILGTVIVLSIRAGRSRFGKVLEAMSLLPEMLPGIVLVIGLMLFWNDIYDILPLYNNHGHHGHYVHRSFPALYRTICNLCLHPAQRKPSGNGAGIRRVPVLHFPSHHLSPHRPGHGGRLDDDIHHCHPGTGGPQSHRPTGYAGDFHLYYERIRAGQRVPGHVHGSALHPPHHPLPGRSEAADKEPEVKELVKLRFDELLERC